MLSHNISKTIMLTKQQPDIHDQIYLDVYMAVEFKCKDAKEAIRTKIRVKEQMSTSYVELGLSALGDSAIEVLAREELRQKELFNKRSIAYIPLLNDMHNSISIIDLLQDSKQSFMSFCIGQFRAIDFLADIIMRSVDQFSTGTEKVIYG